MTLLNKKLILFLSLLLALSNMAIGNDNIKNLSKKNINFYNKNYKELLALSNNYLQQQNLDKALLSARCAFAKADNTHLKAKVLYIIANIYIAKNDLKKAKQLFRQIIQNYSNSKNIVKKSRNKLLSL